MVKEVTIVAPLCDMIAERTADGTLLALRRRKTPRQEALDLAYLVEQRVLDLYGAYLDPECRIEVVDYPEDLDYVEGPVGRSKDICTPSDTWTLALIDLAYSDEDLRDWMDAAVYSAIVYPSPRYIDEDV